MMQALQSAQQPDKLATVKLKGPVGSSVYLPAASTRLSMKPMTLMASPRRAGALETGCPRNVGRKDDRGNVNEADAGGASKDAWYMMPSNAVSVLMIIL